MSMDPCPICGLCLKYCHDDDNCEMPYDPMYDA